MDKAYVIGVGAEGMAGLASRAREIVESADLLVGSARLLALIPAGRAERLVGNPGAPRILDRIEADLGRRRVVALASGDPGFFGAGKALVRRFGRGRVEIVPHVSSVQLAFARIGESWEDAVFLSVHGRSMEGLAASVAGIAKVAILTGGDNTAAAVARCLLSAGVVGHQAFLGENLGAVEERVREVTLEEVAELEASPLSVLVLIRPGEGAEEPAGPAAGPVWPHGIPDEEFHQRRPRRGLITKLEVRAVALARLGLGERSVVWDVGAGSGAVAIEAALLARRGLVYAVERDAESLDLIRRNVQKFRVRNVVPVLGPAPEALAGLAAPDAVFVGGSGGRLSGILDAAGGALRPEGRIVVNAASLETAAGASAGLRERGFAVELSLVQVSRGKDLAGLTHLEALDPVFVVAGRRPVP